MEDALACRGSLVYRLRTQTLRELQSNLKLVQLVDDFDFDVPKCVHFPKPADDVVHEWDDVTFEYARRMPIVREETLPCWAAVIHLGRAMGSVIKLNAEKMHLHAQTRRLIASESFEALWLALAWSKPRPSTGDINCLYGEAATTSHLVEDLQNYVDFYNSVISQTGAILNGPRRSVPVIRCPNMTFVQVRAVFDEHVTRLERMLARWWGRAASEVESSRYGFLQLVPSTTGSNWLQRLDKPSEALKLAALWSLADTVQAALVKPILTPEDVVGKLIHVSNRVAEEVMGTEETYWRQAVPDWGTRDGTEEEELRPLLCELFPAHASEVADEQKPLEDENAAMPAADLSLSCFQTIVRLITLNASSVCDKSSIVHSALRNSMDVLQIDSFAPNDQEHLASIGSLDLMRMFDGLAGQQEWINSDWLVYPNCDRLASPSPNVQGLSFYHDRCPRLLSRFRLPLIKIKNRLLDLAKEYGVGILPQMATVVNKVNQILNLSVFNTPPSAVHFHFEGLWDKLNEWNRRYARHQDKFQQEMDMISEALVGLRQREVAEWSTLCEQRQYKQMRRFITTTSIKIIAAIFGVKNKAPADVLAMVDDLLQCKVNGATVSEIPVIRAFFARLGALCASPSLKHWQDICLTLHAWSERYESSARAWVRQEMDPLYKELTEIQRLMRLETKAVERDRRNLVTKHMQIARVINKMDLIFKTTSGFAYQSYIGTLTCQDRMLTLRVDDLHDLPDGETPLTQHVAVIEELEALLQTMPRARAKRVITNVRNILRKHVPASEWIGYSRSEAWRMLIQSTLRFGRGSQNRRLIAACSEFLGLEETVCDPIFLVDCADWYALVGNTVRKSLEVHASLETMQEDLMLLRSITKVEGGACPVIITRARLCETLSGLNDLLRSHTALALVVDNAPGPVNVEDVSMPSSDGIHDLTNAIGGCAMQVGDEFLYLMSAEFATNTFHALKAALKTYRAALSKTLTRLGFSNRNFVKMSNQMTSVIRDLKELLSRVAQPVDWPHEAIEGVMSGYAHALDQQMTKLYDMNASAVQPTIRSIVSSVAGITAYRIDQALDTDILERLMFTVEQRMAAMVNVPITHAIVATQLARHGMNYEQEEEEPEAKTGQDEFIQGSGLDDGSGINEAKEQLENETDFDTLQNPLSQEDGVQEEHKNNNEGTDVQMGFEGELQDLEENQEDDKSDGPEQENKEDEFGEVDGGNAEGLNDLAPEDDGDGGHREAGDDEKQAADQNDGEIDSSDMMACDDPMDATNKPDNEGPRETEETVDDDGHDQEGEEIEEDNGVQEDVEMDRGPKQAEGDEPMDASETEQANQQTTDDLLSDVESVMTGDDESDTSSVTGDVDMDENTATGADNMEASEMQDEDEAADESLDPEVPDGRQVNEDSAGGAKENDDDQMRDGGTECTLAPGEDNNAQGTGDDDGEGISGEVGEGEDEKSGTIGLTQKTSNSRKPSERRVKQVVDEQQADTPNAPIGKCDEDRDISVGQIDDNAEDVANAVGRMEQDDERHETNPNDERPNVLVEGDEQQDVQSCPPTQLDGELATEKRKGGDEVEENETGDPGSECVLETDEECGSASPRRWIEIQRDVELRAVRLCESLKSILVPTNRGRYEGYYRTGKRLSMRQVISFIASDYRKDRIWLRRTKLSKRDYEVVLAVDNSASMHKLGVHEKSLDTMAMIAAAMKKLEIGKISMCSFGTDAGPRLLTDAELESNINIFQGAQPLKDGFNKAMPALLEYLISAYEGADKPIAERLVIVMTDGRFNQSVLRSQMDHLTAVGIVPILMIIDAVSNEATKATSSIYDVKIPIFAADRSVTMKQWLDPDNCPFEHYTVVNNIDDIDATLCAIIREWVRRTNM